LRFRTQIFNNKGVDTKTPGTGKTTITQGLVKFYYFDHFERGVQKIKQTLIARFVFDPYVPKDTQLLLFINEMYLGVQNKMQIKGLEDAAESYFNKPFRELSEDEYLSLIAMIRNPARFHVLKSQEQNKIRVARIKKVLTKEYLPKDNSDIFYDR
jgi:membrane peptidoglycan carboxypeptidase